MRAGLCRWALLTSLTRRGDCQQLPASLSMSFFLTSVEKCVSCLLLVTHYPPAEALEGHLLYATLRGSQGTAMSETLLIPVFSSIPLDPRFP